MQNIKKYITWFFYGLFFICFSNVVLHMLIQNSAYQFKKLILFTLIIIFLGLFIFAYRKIKKHEEKLEKHYKRIITVFICVMALLQIGIGAILRYTPAFDLDAVYSSAIQLAKGGSISQYEEYLYYFPHNFGIMSFFFAFFKLANFIGIQDFFMVATVLNSILSVSSMLVVTLICKKILGTRYALYSLVIFTMSLPFYIIAPNFYTDGLSMLFPILFYYLYLLVKDAVKLSKQLKLYVFMGLTAGIGIQIKFTVLIMVIAVVIDSLIHCKIKKTIVMTGVTTILIICISTGISSIIYGTLLDKEQAKIRNSPWTHCIMMGLNGTGGYNPSDFEFTRSFTDIEERDKAIKAEIIKRIKERGVNGMYEHLTLKGEYCFGDGTFGLADGLKDTPANPNILHEFVLYDGKYYEGYRHICHGVFSTILILMIFSSLQEILSRERKFRNFLAPRLAVLGLLIFLSFWEANRRLSLNYLPVMILCSIMGIDYFIKHMKIIYIKLKCALTLKTRFEND